MSTSLFAPQVPRMRPAGVRMLALAIFAISAYLIVNGALVMFNLVSFASGAYLLAGLETMGPGIYFLIGTALALLGSGLMRGWRWSRALAMGLAALLLAGAVMPVSAAVIYFHIGGIFLHGLKVIAAIIVIRYLMQPEVAGYFNERNAPRST